MTAVSGLLLMKIILMSLAKSVLLPFGLSAAMSATDTPFQKNVYGSVKTVLIISNEELDDKVKLLISPENIRLLIKGISKTIKNEVKEQKGGCLPILLWTLAASVLGCPLAGEGVIRAGEGVIRTGQMF